MVEVAEIFRLHGPDYRAKFAARMLPSHLRAMQDIEACRTESLGGQLYFCAQCDQLRYSDHSCKNRHCPKCQNQQANEWLQEQKELLLPTHYFLVTFTLPAELRALARSNQKTIYNLLFRASSQALRQLAQDPRFVGARLGMVGVLHTWTRQLLYHPHVHYIVTGGGLTDDGRWRSSRSDFLLPVKALSPIFRAKFRDQLQKSALFAVVAPRVWRRDWVVHSEAVGSGEQAFKYLAPYIFRVAISNTACASCMMAKSLSLTKSRPLTNSSVAPSLRKSSSGASSSTCFPTASSRCVTTACSAPLIGNCYTKPDTCSLPSLAN